MNPINWNEHYTSGGSPPGAPSPFLEENIARLPRGTALDLACGAGRNAIYLALKGYRVDALDNATVAVENLQATAIKESLPIHAQQADLSTCRLAADTYDLIININFLERSLFSKIKKGLKRGGVILFETYTSEQSRFGHPHNPDYLLKPNELLRGFGDLHIIFYHERIEGSLQQTRAIASLVAEKR